MKWVGKASLGSEGPRGNWEGLQVLEEPPIDLGEPRIDPKGFPETQEGLRGGQEGLEDIQKRLRGSWKGLKSEQGISGGTEKEQ